MQVRELILSSSQALKGNLLRTSLTVLGIVIGISSVILISSIGQGAVAFINDQLSVFGTNFFRVAPGENPFSAFAGTNSPITTDDAQALKDADISNVNIIAPVAVTSRNISAGEEKTATSIYGTDPDTQLIFKPEILYGDFLTEADNESVSHVAVVGVNISEDIFGENTNPVGQSLRIDNSRYRIIGVSQASGAFGNIFNNGINIPINTMITDVTGKDELLEIVISVDNQDRLKETITDVEDTLREYRDIEEGEEADFFTQSFVDTLGTITSVTSLLTLAVAGISAISLIVGGVGVMNIMLVTVTERTREIGLLKAIGAKERDILVQFLVESVTLSLLGGIIGIATGIAGAFLVSLVAGIPFVVSPITIVLAVITASAVGAAFGLYPARRAARLNPIDALRYE